ncbi:serine/Arginine-related protein 53-like [Salvelinus alpinus]
MPRPPNQGSSTAVAATDAPGSRERRRSRSRSSGRSSRKKSRSHSRDHSRRKGRDKDKEKDRDNGRDRDKDRAKDKDKRPDKQGDSTCIKAALEHLTPAEQARARLQLVLQAAAKTDEVLKAKERKDEEAKKMKLEEGTSLAEQVRRIKDIEAIESESFVPQAFKSSRDGVKTESVKVEQEPDDPPLLLPDISSLPTTIRYNDSDTLAHPSLFLDKEKAEELWLNRLMSLRQERLMGSPVP